ncbi:hypothetical protein TNCV_836341 [Trichonephila clavipes]|nr:hypothetical protein TNCV_836341 [Trichonephila clavipes]
MFVREETTHRSLLSFPTDFHCPLSRIFGYRGTRHYILELHPIRGWGEVFHGAKDCRGDDRTAQYLGVHVYIGTRSSYPQKEDDFSSV